MRKSVDYSPEIIEIFLSLWRFESGGITAFCQKYDLNKKLFKSWCAAKSARSIKFLPVIFDENSSHEQPMSGE